MEPRTDLRLGQVLIDIGMVTGQQLDYALDVAKNVGLPVGRVLVMSGFVSERDFQAGVQIQSLLKDNLLDFAKAKQIAELIIEQSISLEQAIDKIGWQRPQESESNKLGPLLVDAGFVSNEQLDDALMKSRSSGVPFGRILVLNGVLPETLLASALNAQILIRDRKVTRKQAVNGLRSAKKRQVTVELPLMESGYYRLPTRHTIRLGELLVLAGLMTESDMMYAVEVGLINEKPIGQVLVELQYITQEVLDSALEFQNQVAAGEMRPLQAANRLTEINHFGLVMAPPLPDKIPETNNSEQRDKTGSTTNEIGQSTLSAVVPEPIALAPPLPGHVASSHLGNQSGESGATPMSIPASHPNTALVADNNQAQGQARAQAPNLDSDSRNHPATNLAPPLQSSIELDHDILGAESQPETARQNPPGPDAVLTNALGESSGIRVRVNVSLSQFLTLVGVVSEDDIQKAIEVGIDAPQILGRMLLLAGVIDEATLKAALRCYALVREGLLGTEQAFIAYNYSQHSGISIDEALQELGVTRNRVESNTQT